MKESDLISVIIPVHNGAKTLMRALQSVAVQEVDKEIIVVDDFSTDDSFKIAKGFAEIGKLRMRVVKTGSYRSHTQAKGGPNVPRNIGVSLAKGTYIALLDQDDWWYKNKLSLQLKAITLWKADICTTSFIAVNKVSSTCRLHGKKTGQVVHQPDMLFRFLSRDKSKQTLMSTMLFRKDVYPQMDEKMGVSDYLWTAELLENHKVVVIELPLMLRGVDNKNTSLSKLYRQITLEEQIATMDYYGKKYGYDLAEAKMGVWASYGKYCYMTGRYKEARESLRKAPISIKITMYCATSFIPPLARLISKKFNVFGDN